MFYKCSHLRWNSVKVLSQHPPHMLAGVGGHLVLEQEGEHAALTDAVEVAVHLVVLAACTAGRKSITSY